MSDDSIIAIASGPAPGAVGVVRISGSLTPEIVARVARRPGGQPIVFGDSPRTALLVDVGSIDGDTLDRGLITCFPAPHSYTAEDVAEFALHGNPILLRQFVSLCLESSKGRLRPAEPGEFTRRAYTNGKLDLTAAEAVHRIITARSDFELEASRRNLYGELSQLTSRFRSAIIHLKAEVEAEVDFSTEDLTFETPEERLARINDLIQQIDSLLERGNETRRLANGIQVALAGVPNAGKSSLLNRLIGRDRAIVSEQEGTTRDYLSEDFQLDGVTLRFVDTAGLRESNDLIEQEGVKFSRRIVSESDLVLHVIDGSRSEHYPFPDFPEPSKVLHVLNKVDLASAIPAFGEALRDMDHLSISCKTGEGIGVLKNALRARVFHLDRHDAPLLLEERVAHHFREAKGALVEARGLMVHAAPDEIVALEIDRALEHTGKITGRIDNEEVLGRIFSVFCVGK